MIRSPRGSVTLVQRPGGGWSLQAGDDLDAVDYFPLDAAPPLAFPTDRLAIEQLREGTPPPGSAG